MATRTAPSALLELVFVGSAKPGRIPRQDHPHAKPALKACSAACFSYGSLALEGTDVAGAWHLLGRSAEWHVPAWSLGTIWGEPGVQRHLLTCTRIMRDGDAGVDRDGLV